MKPAATARAEDPRVVAFLNSAAGSAEAARKALESAGAFDIRETDAEAMTRQIREAVDSGSKRVLVCGGDGTIASAAHALAGTGVELAIVPGGTLNHFARDHHIPIDLAEALTAARGDASAEVDVGYVGDKLFLNTFSVGMYVGYVRTRDRLEKRVGYRLASFLAVLRTFVRMYTMHVELEVDGQVRRYKTALVFVGVGERELKVPKLGARIEGGRHGLHVMIVEGRRRARLVALAMAAAARGVEHAAAGDALDAFIVERCTIHLARWRAPVAVDGEIMSLPAPLELRVERNALKVVAARCP
ncbi:MAG: diacylglycerol kinase family protein [Gemmatimonadaceae bacterium]